MTTHGFSSRFVARGLVAGASRRFGSVVLLAASLCTVSALHGQDAEDRRRRATPNGEDPQGRRAFNPADLQARMATAMRERLEITDDEEWKLVSERILKVTELRRATSGGGGPLAGAMMGARGGPGAPGGPGGNGDAANRGGARGGRGGTANPELGALQAAVRDKLPEAEIKVRLAKLRETRKSDEAKLAKAQEELRAVLTVRQEAVAVVFGLLP